MMTLRSKQFQEKIEEKAFHPSQNILQGRHQGPTQCSPGDRVGLFLLKKFDLLCSHQGHEDGTSKGAEDFHSHGMFVHHFYVPHPCWVYTWLLYNLGQKILYWKTLVSSNLLDALSWKRLVIWEIIDLVTLTYEQQLGMWQQLGEGTREISGWKRHPSSGVGSWKIPAMRSV